MNSRTNWYHSIFDFNQYYRDNWVAKNASKIPPGSCVLDIGSGFGRYKDLFEHCDYKTQDFCQYNGPEWNYCNIDYVSDITNIPVDDGSFDIILCTEVLELVPEPIKAIKEFSRILRENGALLLTAPLGCGIHQPPFIYYGGYTPYWYEKFLPEFGFEIIQITPNGGFFKHYGQESIRFLRYLFPENMSPMAKKLTLPIKIVLAGFFRVLMPFLCYHLDRLDNDRHFTVGYFVEAVKKK